MKIETGAYEERGPDKIRNEDFLKMQGMKTREDVREKDWKTH